MLSRRNPGWSLSDIRAMSVRERNYWFDWTVYLIDLEKSRSNG